jgi:hypothetical protein
MCRNMAGKSPERIGAVLTPPHDRIVERLRARGCRDSEIVRRGIRLVAEEENIPIEELA